jgi:hypothetical protein
MGFALNAISILHLDGQTIQSDVVARGVISRRAATAMPGGPPAR